MVTHVVVGADRIAANGDTANKIGTYTVSVLAREHGVPFYVAAPLSTIDCASPTGRTSPSRSATRARSPHVGGYRVAPEGVRVRNPAFDVTPAANISAIITEAGVATRRTRVPGPLSRHPRRRSSGESLGTAGDVTTRPGG